MEAEMKETAALLFVAFLLGGCQLLTSTETSVEVSSDREVYSAGETITISVVNQGTGTVYLLHACNLDAERHETRLEVLIDGQWQQALRPLGCHPTYSWTDIGVGETYSREFALSDLGTYRYRFALYETTDDSSKLPETQRVSNRFIVQE
jgi:hypothetical protein